MDLKISQSIQLESAGSKLPGGLQADCMGTPGAMLVMASKNCKDP